MSGGFIKVNRSILASDIIREPVTFTVFMYLILSARFSEGEYNGEKIKRGETVTSYPRIALATGITERQARTALSKLIKSGKVSVRRYPKFSVVTLKDYENFQGMSDRKSGESQSNDSLGVTQMSPIKEIKNDKENKNGSCCMESGGDDEEDEDYFKLNVWSKGGHVMLSDMQAENLLDLLSLDEFNFYLDKLDRFIGEKHAAVKNHYETILKWVSQDREIRA